MSLITVQFKPPVGQYGLYNNARLRIYTNADSIAVPLAVPLTGTSLLAPTTLYQSNATTGTVTVSWQDPNTYGAATPALSFTVNGTPATCSSLTSNSCTLAGLAAATVYSVQMTEAIGSATVNSNTIQAATLLNSPDTLTVSGTTNVGFTLNWTDAKNTYPSGVSPTYSVQVDSKPISNCTNISTMTCTVMGQLSGYAHSASVSISANGATSAASTQTAQTGFYSLTGYTQLSPHNMFVANLQITDPNIYLTTPTYTFSAPIWNNCSVIGELEVCNSITPTQSTSTPTVTGGSTYQVHLRELQSCNTVTGSVSVSNLSSLQTIPGNMNNLSKNISIQTNCWWNTASIQETSGADSMQVAISDPNTYDDNAPVYTVVATPIVNGVASGTPITFTSTTSGSQWQLLGSAGDSIMMSLSGLDAETQYQLALTVTDSGETSDTDTLNSPTTGESSPVSLAATSVTPTGFTLNWTDTNNYNSGETPTYTVTLNGNPATCTLSGASCVFTGLLPGVTYTAAVSVTAEGVASTASSLTVVTQSVYQINLASLANLNGFNTDASTFSTGGLDGNGNSYSSNQLGAALTWNGVPFTFGASNSLNAVYGTTIPLPYGQFSAIKLLATGIDGTQASQSLLVTYTDGTTASFTQNFSDWWRNAGSTLQSGESQVVGMSYVDQAGGTEYGQSVFLDGYSFNLNPNKIVQSITLPNNRDVIVFAVSLTGAGIPVNLSSSGNVYAAYSDGASYRTGGLDGAGNAYSATQLGANLSWSGEPFVIGASGTQNGVSQQTISLPVGQFSTLELLGAAVNGNQSAQNFIVNYSDGTSATFTQNLSNWLSTTTSQSGESFVKSMSYVDTSSGAQSSQMVSLNGYRLNLNNTKTVKSLQLPANRNVVLLAATLNGAVTAPYPGVTGLAAQYNGSGPTTLSWNAPSPLLPGSSVTYNISWGSGSVTGVTSTSYVVPASAMSVAHLYTFSVTPVVNGVVGTASSITAGGGVISPPLSFTVTGTSSSSISLSWNPFTGDADSNNISFVIGYLPANASACSLVVTGIPIPCGYQTVNATNTTATLTGLAANTNYNIVIATYDSLLGAWSQTTSTLNVSTSEGQAVSLSSSGNVYAMYTDGTSFGTGGIDYSPGSGTAYSATLIGSSLVWNGNTFQFSAANTANGVRSTTVTLPSGQYNTLNFLATGVDGNQTSQNFIVTYTDGSTTTFAQSLSDWFSPQNYTGESIALATAYRNEFNGTKNTGPFNIYGYTLNLNAAKTVKSLQLPSNTHVIVLAITLAGHLATITEAPTSTMIQANPGQALIFTSLIDTGGVAPTGTVGFQSGNNLLGAASVSTVTTTNLVPYSQQLTNTATWQGYCTNKGFNGDTANTTDFTAPDGSTTATKFVVPGTGVGCGGGNAWGAFTSLFAPVSGQSYTVSIWLRGANGGETMELGLNDCANTGLTLTNSWHRYSVTFSAITSAQVSCDGGRGMQFSGITASTFYAWGAQVEKASALGPYIPTTSTSATGSGGSASLGYIFSSAGTYPITATYSGNNTLANSTSANTTVETVP